MPIATVSPKLSDLMDRKLEKKKEENKHCPSIASFIRVYLRNKERRITYFPCEASKRVGEEVVNLWIRRRRRSSLLASFSALLFLFPYFLFLLPIFLCLFHLRVFVLGRSYPLYTATRLKVKNWPVRYIAWVLSFCGAIEITVIWELPPVQLRREGKIERLPSKEIALRKFSGWKYLGGNSESCKLWSTRESYEWKPASSSC